jgi:glycerol-3-phosphate dehydrogenase
LGEQTFDLVVIGGGIVGCGIARDAALRGLRVALFEKEDFGSGTSSRSTRLIHGGLRYLELLDFGLVRQDLREREILLRTAPHRVKPLTFLVPLYRRSGFYRLKLRVGMRLYDLLSYGKSLPNHRFLNAAETLRIEPGLAREGLQGAALYMDAQADLPERLCLDNALDAVEHRACLYNHTEVIGLLRGQEGRVEGVTVRDMLTGEEAQARGTVVVNAAGPWLDRLEARLTDQEAQHLRLTKGIHFAAPPAVQHALVLFAPQDARLMFVIPWLGYSWVGTTDTDFVGDLETVRATGEEVRYLLDAARPALPAADWRTVYYAQAGVRALVREAGAERESDVSRKHRLIEHTAEEGLAGLISVLGGKLTAYRQIAAETVNMARWIILRQRDGDMMLYRYRLAPTVTDKRPLPGGDFNNAEALLAEACRRAQAVGLTWEQAAHLVRLYGTRYTEALDRIQAQPELRQPIAVGIPNVRAEIIIAIEREFARTAADVLMRRTGLFFQPDQGRAALPVVIEMCAQRLGWDAARRQAEIAAYEAQIALTQAFRAELDSSFE